MTQARRTHLITGGFPSGTPAGHDMNFARLRLLEKLGSENGHEITVANDFQDIERWLPKTDFLITYVAGPFPSGDGNKALQNWLSDGGKWFALHGTSGGKAVKAKRDEVAVKQMVKMEHHDTLGCFFLNHPPISQFQVTVKDAHPVTRGLPDSFTVQDELYMIELQDPDETTPLFTTKLEKDPSPLGFGFVYDKDTSLLDDGETRVLGYTRTVGKGEVVYVGLGHCHIGRDGSLSPVDTTIDPNGKMPAKFHSVWHSDAFNRLLANGIAWGIGRT